MSATNKAQIPTAGALDDIDSSARNPLGLIVPDQFGNEYMYVQGVASAAAGDFCVVNSDYSTARLVSTPLSGRVGVYMAALVASKFGWIQITGLVSATQPGNGITAANIASDGSADKKALFQSATPGRATTSVAAGNAIMGAWGSGAAASNVGNAWLSRPTAPGYTLASA